MTAKEENALLYIQGRNRTQETPVSPRSVITRRESHAGGKVHIAPRDPSSIHFRKEVERWFLALRDPVFRFLRSLGCQHSLAEELTQEAFFRLYRSLQDGLQVGDARAWVFRVARNLWIDSRREHQRYTTSQDEGRPDLTHGDSSPDPEQQALQSERIRIIEEEVLRLPELERECMQLRAQGLRYHEIARALDISRSAAVDCVRRAVKKLRKAVRD